MGVEPCLGRFTEGFYIRDSECQTTLGNYRYRPDAHTGSLKAESTRERMCTLPHTFISSSLLPRGDYPGSTVSIG